MLSLLVIGAVLLILANGTLNFAQPAPPAGNGTPPEREPTDEEKRLDALAEQHKTTRHTATIGGRKFAYTATAGMLPLREEQGPAKAYAFYIAYTRDGGRSRPVTFCFNGGPGSSSVWLHLGAFGPLRVDTPDDPTQPALPGRLVRNAESLLDVTDLVFIDPVMTGYSRPVRGEKREQFHGVTEDVNWVGEFVRLWTTRNGRWDSAKFLAGESYGTMRAAALVGHLQNRHGMYFNGIILVSSVLNGVTLMFEQGNDLSHLLVMPTLAATAWYHRRLEPALQKSLPKTIAAAREFAMGEYATALLQGDRLPTAQRQRVAAQLSRLLGLPVDLVERADLRLNVADFTRELLRGEGQIIGRLDGRYAGYALDAVGGAGHYDPSYSAIQGVYTSAMNSLVRQTLKFETDLPYEILTDRVRPWNWKYEPGNHHYVTVMPTLRDAMTKNTQLRVLVANGYYDMATPFLASEYTFAHLGLAPALRKNVSLTYYESGHMMYVHGPSRRQLKADIAKFIRGA